MHLAAKIYMVMFVWKDYRITMLRDYNPTRLYCNNFFDSFSRYYNTYPKNSVLCGIVGVIYTMQG